MPKAPRVMRQGKGVARDPQTGNMIGGVRPPWIKVPSAMYLTDYETVCGTAYDTKVPYPAERLKTLYGSYANYARRFDAAKRDAIQEGYLLPEDATRIKPIASPEDFGRPGRTRQ